MSFDLALTSYLDFYLTGQNDLALVSGIENAKQSVALSSLDATEIFIGDQITHERINRLKGNVRDELLKNPHVDSVQSTEVISVDRNNHVVDVGVKVNGSEEFTINLSNPV